MGLPEKRLCLESKIRGGRVKLPLLDLDSRFALNPKSEAAEYAGRGVDDGNGFALNPKSEAAESGPRSAASAARFALNPKSEAAE